MRISVTGANGFLGTKIVNRLIKEGHYVIAWGRDPVPWGQYKDYRYLDLEKNHNIDFSDTDIIIHCAAYIPTNYGDFSEAEKCNKINGIGTLKLIRAAIASNVKKFIHISTGQLYSWKDPTSEVREIEAMYPSERATSYLVSKFMGEVYVDSYKNDINAVILRPSYIYGPGMKSGGLLHRLTNALKNNEYMDVNKIGRYYIDLVYVDDVVEMVYLSATNENIIGTYNVGGGDAVNTYELIAELSNVLNKPSPKIPPIKIPLDFDRCHPMLDISKAISVGYKPTERMIGLTDYVRSLK